MDNKPKDVNELSNEERLEEIKKIAMRINCQTLWEKDRFVTDEQFAALQALSGIKVYR